MFELADAIGKYSSTEKKVETLCRNNIKAGGDSLISEQLRRLKMRLYEWSGVCKKEMGHTDKYLVPVIQRIAKENLNFHELFNLRDGLAKECINSYKNFESTKEHGLEVKAR